MTLQEVREAVQQVDRITRNIMKKAGVEWLDDMDIDDPEGTPESRFAVDQYREMLTTLQVLHNQLDQTKRPVKRTGTLHRGEDGRYYIGDQAITCGYAVEILVFDEVKEADKWHAGHMEADREGRYYISGHNGNIDGLQARCRW